MTDHCCFQSECFCNKKIKKIIIDIILTLQVYTLCCSVLYGPSDQQKHVQQSKYYLKGPYTSKCTIIHIVNIFLPRSRHIDKTFCKIYIIQYKTFLLH